MTDFPGYRVSILNCDGHVIERFDYNVAALKAAGVDEGSIPFCPLAAFQRAMSEGKHRDVRDRWDLLEDEFITVHVVDSSRSSRDIYTFAEWQLQYRAEMMAG